MRTYHIELDADQTKRIRFLIETANPDMLPVVFVKMRDSTYHIIIDDAQSKIIADLLASDAAAHPATYADATSGTADCVTNPLAYLPQMFADLATLPDHETGDKMLHGFSL